MKITIKLNQNDFNSMLLNGAFLDKEYEIKKVSIDDSHLKDNEQYQMLTKAAIKAYKDKENYLYENQIK